MRFSHFEYFSPTTIEETIGLLQSKGPGARLMAGGTDLLIKMRHAGLKPSAIIAIKGIAELNHITFDSQNGLTIGATALLADVAEHPDILKHYPTVAEAARGTANVQIRNMGTVIGNLCNASPSADNAPTLLVLGAQVQVQGPEGTRTIPLEQFFKGPGLTALNPSEIVTSVQVPLPEPKSATAYISLSARGRLDCTAVGAAAMVALNGGTCKDIRLFIGACGPTPLRAVRAEEILLGQAITDEAIAQAGEISLSETKPITDVRASADYRSKMVAVLTRRVIKQAYNRALEQ